MTWYYLSGTEQKGPVDQDEFERLIRQGDITETTVVWREGMANWQPYSEVAAPSEAPPALSLRQRVFVCSECGRTFPTDQGIRLGHREVCAGCKPIAVQKLREGLVDSEAEEIRKKHIRHEASIKSVGVLYFLGSAFMVVAGFTQLASPRAGQNVMLAVLFLGLAAVQIWAGIGLRRLKLPGRLAAGILSGLGLLAFPVGTIINGYILYLLYSKKGSTVFSPEYKQVIEATPHIKYRTSIVIWILLGLVFLLIGMGLFAVFFFPPQQ